jgi:hypothetical protein
VNVDEIDDDAVHIDEHVRFVLSEFNDLNDEQKQNYYTHITVHRERINIEAGMNTASKN